MEIKRAIITAAGKSQRTLPLQSLVDRDGQTKTALAIIIEEVLAAGIEELSVVVCPGDEKTYRTAAGEHAKRLEFVEQKQPLGYGHAVLCAAKFVGKAIPAAGRRPALRQRRSAPLCATARRGRGQGGLRGVRRAGHAREWEATVLGQQASR